MATSAAEPCANCQAVLPLLQADGNSSLDVCREYTAEQHAAEGLYGVGFNRADECSCVVKVRGHCEGSGRNRLGH